MSATYKNCHDVRDLHTLLFQRKYTVLIPPDNRQENKLKRSQKDEADRIWKTIEKKFNSMLIENGFIQVGKDDAGALSIKTNQAGRPYKLDRETLMNEKISIRLDHDTRVIIDRYCQENDVSMSEALRKAISLLQGKDDS